MSDYRMMIRRTGGPDVIEREAIETPQPQAGEAVVRHRAIGLNFIDTYQRSGLYPVSLPSGLGGEAAGIVEAVGDGVTTIRVGDRVGYAGPIGAYATVRAIDAALLLPLPDTIDDAVAAAAILKGLTADMLVGACGQVRAGQTVLVHAAAGGVGSLLVPWLRAIGAKVIAHVGSPAKAARVAALGADHVLHGTMDGLAGEVRALTGGEGVNVVLDGVGKDSFGASLDALARRGLLVSYGNASGAVEPFAPLELARRGSLTVTRPTLYDYLTTREERLAAAARLFGMIETGKVTVEIGQSFPLSDAAGAHRALEARTTIGSTILRP